MMTNLKLEAKYTNSNVVMLGVLFDIDIIVNANSILETISVINNNL